MPNIIRTGGGVVDQKVYFYNAGDECTALTGGWSEIYRDASQVGTITEGADRITIFRNVSTAWGGIAEGTANAIDLTNVSTLYIDWSAAHGGSITGAAKFTVNPTKLTSSSTTATAQINSGVDFARKVDSIDVSALTGMYYIAVAAINDANFSATKTVVVYSIWME